MASNGAPARWLGLSGRISRQTWWLHYTLAISVATAAAWIVAHAVPNAVPGALLFICVAAFGTVAAFCGAVQRLHDRGMGGWWLLLGLVPLLGGLALLIVLGFLPGTRGPNRFGNDPRGDARTPARPLRRAAQV